MSATEVLREDVKELIDHADERALRMVKAMLEVQEEEELEENMETEDWDNLPEQLQMLLTEAAKECEEGKVTPHSQVLEKYSKWFGK